jgi:hypothetical protein
VRGVNGRPVPNARVEVQGAPVVTDANGHFHFDVVNFGTRVVSVRAACARNADEDVVFDGNEVKNFVLIPALDLFDHVCRDTALALAPTTKTLALTGDDQRITVSLPFGFPFYGTKKDHAVVSTNGYLLFADPTPGTEDFRNGGLLDVTTPVDGVFAFWDDLVIDENASVRTATAGVAPNRTFTVEWRSARFASATERVTVQAVLFESGRIVTSWHADTPADRSRGDSATIGIRNSFGGDGALAVQRSRDVVLGGDGVSTEFVTDRAPVAKAGPDRTIGSNGIFTLDGSASTDPDGKTGLTYRWLQTAGPKTTLEHPKQIKTRGFGIKGPVNLTFQLQVIDPFGLPSTDSVVVHIKAPAA